MKSKIILFSMFLCIVLSGTAQKMRTGRIERYPVDIFGNLQYDSRDGFRASWTKNIFDDITYTDNHNNKLKYTKKFLDKMGYTSAHEEFGKTIRYFRNKRGVEQDYSVDIFDALQYKNNKGFSATLKPNIFEDVIYSDSNGNEIKYGKKFLNRFQLRYIQALDSYLFMDMLYSSMDIENNKEVYDINIFDNFIYTNNQGAKVELQEEYLGSFYKRNRDGQREFSWDALLDYIHGDTY